MSCKWIPTKVTLNASRIPVQDRVEFMISNALQPIPEHKFDTLYFHLFNEVFKPSSFGRFSNITELIASKPNVYRTISNDGRAYIQYHKPNSNNNTTYKHTIPRWSVKSSNKIKIFGKISIIFKLYRDNKYIRNIDLTEILFNNINKCFLTFGRDNNCDFTIQHPSISRIHSIFQFSNDGSLFIYDVSLHGILINNKNIPKKKYVECKNNDKIRFGHSSRIYYLIINNHGKNKNNFNTNCIQINTENEYKESENLTLQNNQQKNEINRLQKTIDKLTMDLNKAQQTIGNQSKKVISLMEQMECLNLTDSCRKRRELKELKNRQELENKNEESENENEEEYDAEKEEKRISKINGIDFVTEINNLSNLTVVKLRYYTDKNNINVGRVKKSELVKIIKKDVKNHFDL